MRRCRLEKVACVISHENDHKRSDEQCIKKEDQCSREGQPKIERMWEINGYLCLVGTFLPSLPFAVAIARSH